ncbi:Lysine exporter protein (LYSE/YGGA) [Methylobacterium sp. 4-46]|uniref:LysE family translocator n=1 Tax=unclassified Methylobacterium TaxID=2615210 RepID=UPI000152CA05|nr:MULTISPECIES: LysE family translocator [Methylobacterium]ACA20800.1 Lysine exporter protein (LYSE/YGGA) [Methylobacterium sp. 4-46]WFT79954.1 LysE family translocator [Methylobacterium nodulans]
MMPLDLYLAFVAASVVLVLIPGPNVALIVANSLAHGARAGLATVAGTSAAMAVQLALTALGATTLLAALAGWFGWLRLLGAAYLVWLGLRAWRAPPLDLAAARPAPGGARAMIGRGFLVALVNPKTLLFYAAFLPQFLTPDGDAPGQLLLLCATFLAIAAGLDSLWAVLAGRLRGALRLPGRWRNRLSGLGLIGAGLGLALARRPAG